MSVLEEMAAKQVRDLDDKIRRLGQEIESLEKTKQSKNDEIEALKANIEALTKRKSGLEVEISDGLKTIDEHRDSVQKFLDSKETYLNEASVANSAKEKEISELSQSNQAKINEIYSLKKNISDLLEIMKEEINKKFEMFSDSIKGI